MAHIRKAEITSPIVTLGGESTSRVLPALLVAAIACIGAAFFFGGAFSADGRAAFMHSYLVSYMFFLTITLGCIFFVMIQHLTKAGWSVTVRRVAEIMGCAIFPMAILFIPILLSVLSGDVSLYTWVDEPSDGAPAWAVGDPRIFDIKSTFLNPTWFAIRAVIYFTIWTFVAFRLYTWSIKQDETGDKQISLKSQAFCAPLMLGFVLSLAFAAFDWEMSLAPMWFSTMFPVYIFAGCVLSSLATILLVCLLLQKTGRITDEITIEHYHDLAKLCFAFIFFWGYIAFSQFMLIWYANIPEETFWYRFRFEGGWVLISLVLLFGHLFIPFLGMMARTVRRNKTYLLFAAIFLLAMHWVDHYWIVMPQLNASVYEGYFSGGEPITKTEYVQYPNLIDLLLFVGMGALFVASFCVVSGNRALVPLKDPRLHEALNYDNP